MSGRSDTPERSGPGLSDDQALREIVVFLSHYAGWPSGARINSIVEETIARDKRRRERAGQADA